MSSSSYTPKPVILWFRQDLRLQDNPALAEAIQAEKPILALYIFDENGEREWALGGASRWWLHQALLDLRAQLKKLGGELVLRRGDTLSQLRDLLNESGADAVYWNRRYEPPIIKRDGDLKQVLKEEGFDVQSFNSVLLHEPHTVTKKDGTPFKVFTPYWKHCLKLPKSKPVKISLKKVHFVKDQPRSEAWQDWQLLPEIPWDKEFCEAWDPTSKGARRLLKQCVQSKLPGYNLGRDILDKEATSRLSPYLHFGQIGPRQIWEAIRAHEAAGGEGSNRYLAEIGWREFSYYLMFHFSHTPLAPMRAEFDDFPWEKDEALLSAWQGGRTGFPVVDAGMRQLWRTGWMHNRARMITASFLVKHLLQPWQDGARWFWDTLVDADLASNTQGWQWTAGCGADASPYFRVFNPIIQGEKFDTQGSYVRRWVPELSKLPNAYIHKPWAAPDDVLMAAGVKLGETYPEPLIEHAAGRARALRAYELFKVST